MDDSRRVSSYEYKNEFLSFIIRQAPEQGQGAFLFCSGINLTRFFRLSEGSYGICSNPAFKGLQLLKADVSAFCRKKGVTPKNSGERPCADISLRGDGWYRESLLLENVPTGFPRELLLLSVAGLLQRVLPVCRPGLKLPRYFPDPRKLQAYLESLTS